LTQAQAQFAALNGNGANDFAAAAITGTTGTFSGSVTAANATTSNGLVTLSQAQSDFAAINGNPSNQFQVANAVTGQEAVPLIQTIGAGAAAYTNQTSSRAFGTAYTNSTGRPLFVIINIIAQNVPPNTYFTVNAYVGSTPVGQNYTLNTGTINGNYSVTHSFFVPVNASYSVDAAAGTGTVSINSWVEY
jgi:hypothetical protein